MMILSWIKSFALAVLFIGVGITVFGIMAAAAKDHPYIVATIWWLIGMLGLTYVLHLLKIPKPPKE